MNYEHIRHDDPEIYESMMRELQRQRDHIELIASENFVSEAVMEAMGSHLTNKYAEGYPGARYYGGCDFVDEVERIAIDRAKKIYGAEHVNVQPHAGSQANVAVYLALLKPGDTILGMSLAEGGHLTHGRRRPSPASTSTRSPTASAARPSGSTMTPCSRRPKRLNRSSSSAAPVPIRDSSITSGCVRSPIRSAPI